MERNIAFSTALEHVVGWRSLLRVIWYTIWQIHFCYGSTVGSSRRWWQKHCQYFTVIGFSFLFYNVVMMMVMNDGLGYGMEYGMEKPWPLRCPVSIILGMNKFGSEAKAKLINQIDWSLQGFPTWLLQGRHRTVGRALVSLEKKCLAQVVKRAWLLEFF